MQKEHIFLSFYIKTITQEYKNVLTNESQPWQICNLKYLEMKIEAGLSGANQGQTGPNGAKWCQTGSNGAKQGQTGQNWPKSAFWGHSNKVSGIKKDFL